MRLKTEISIKKSKLQIDFLEKLFFMGSCFSENIGEKMQSLQFKVSINPFGTLYNSSTIYKNFLKGIHKTPIQSTELVQSEGLFFHYDFHHKLGHKELEEANKLFNNQVNLAHEQISGSNLFVITLGTAWGWQLKENEQIVGNCHKIPAKYFSRVLLEKDMVYNDLQDLWDHLKLENPLAQMILTLSPVRHLREGAIPNQRSKSILLTAIHEIVETNKDVHYFPAYEIMMDDLRDYRFYASDLIHPNEVAIQYIWQKFMDQFMSDDTQSLIAKIEEVKKSIEHKSFHPTSVKHMEFLKETVNKLNKLQEEHEFMDFSQEIFLLNESIRVGSRKK